MSFTIMYYWKFGCYTDIASLLHIITSFIITNHNIFCVLHCKYIIITYYDILNIPNNYNIIGMYCYINIMSLLLHY